MGLYLTEQGKMKWDTVPCKRKSELKLITEVTCKFTRQARILFNFRENIWR